MSEHTITALRQEGIDIVVEAKLLDLQEASNKATSALYSGELTSTEWAAAQTKYRTECINAIAEVYALYGPADTSEPELQTTNPFIGDTI